MTFQESIDQLTNGEASVSAPLLAHLSTLGSEELDAFKDAWAETQAEVRRKTVGMLVELAEDNIELDFSAVLRHALQDEEEDIRTKAINGLWECAERWLIPSLIDLMAEDSSETVRAAAAQGLGRFALLTELGKLLERDAARITDALLSTIDNDEESVEVRRRAIEAVSPMSVPRVAEIIDEAYESGDDEVRASALYAMGRTCDPKWLPVLLTELDNPAPEFRYEALTALGELGEEEAVVYIIAMINDVDPQVQSAALGALGGIGGAMAKRALSQAAKHPDGAVAELAKDGLERIAFEADPLG
jgi:HEAT repeat protein